MKRVLFAGELNVDVMMGGMATPPIVDREVPCKTYDVVLGGSTTVCACAYASLGGDATFASQVGKDDFATFLLREIREYGVKTDYVSQHPVTRTGVTVNMISGNARTQATYPGTIEEFDGAGLDETVLRKFNHIHFAGLYLETNLRPKMKSLLETAKRAGLTTSLDPQWDSTEQWEYIGDWMPLLDFLFVNEDEAASITKAATPREALQALLKKTKLPVVKLGKEGVLVSIDGEIRNVKGREVKPVDTTGAGDSFDAGFLYATLELGLPLLEAAQFGNATAARSCLFVGGVNARSSQADVQCFLNDGAK